ncbi:dynein axonemal heavy chain 2-like [Petromyzon marinus]|uniref:dynein axonemal heavy chain 2-like n=1 Tax=Petromyzon marinus TaxID=7757 RepID=UPI003F71D7A1
MLVDSFKAASSEIARGCRRMSETLLLRIDDHDEEEVEVEEVDEVVEVVEEGRGRRNRRVFSAGEFVPEQRRRRDAALGRLLREHEGLLALLRRTHEAFRSDGAEVQQCWAQHMECVERRVQEALRVNVRRSLQALARALGVAGTGVAGVAGGADGAAAPSPLFRVLVGLQQQPVQASGTPQVEFEPSLALLSEEVSGVSAAVCAAVSAFKRLALSPDDDAGGEPRELIPCIAESEEIRKIRLAIDAGMAQNAAQLQAYLKTWVAYREIWEINKDAFIRRYQRQNPPVSSFDGDIGRYAEVANNVQKEETVLSVQFVLLDCSPLKLSLLRHCSEWQAKLTSLLADMAGGQLRDLHAYLRDNGERVSRPPRTLDELGDALRLLGALQAEGPRVAARLGPIHEQFAILHKHEVPVDAEVSRMLESLTAQHLSFQQCLLDSEAMLRRRKEHFRSGLLHSADEFKRRVQSLVDDFHTHGPFSSAVSCGDALGQVCNLRGQLNGLKLEENDLRRGLGIFKMEQAPSKEMQALDKDLELLESVWELAREWELCWSSWKLGHFASLDCVTMEATAHSHHRQMIKLARDAKDTSWEVVSSTKARLEQFRRTMPLIAHLRNPAMRERYGRFPFHSRGVGPREPCGLLARVQPQQPGRLNAATRGTNIQEEPAKTFQK